MGLILALMLSLGCGPAELQTSDSAAPIPEPIPELGIHVTEDCGQTAIGDTACNFALIDQDGEYWQLKHHRGEVVVLDFTHSFFSIIHLGGNTIRRSKIDIILICRIIKHRQ